MKAIKHKTSFFYSFFCAFLLLGLPSVSKAVNYSGNYNVGTAGTWNNLTSAFTAISAGTVTGNINLILVTGYPAAAETYPIVPSTNNGTYTVTIYPGTAGLSITSAVATGTLKLNGCTNYIFDGRVNEAGAMNLIIANTNVGGYAIQLINGAAYNTVEYCNVQGVNTSVASGVVFFSTAAATGNNYNTVDHCDIHDGATTPYDCINSTGTAGKENTNNTISNCNIYNFYNETNNEANGIDIETGNQSWTITGNSLYQTVARVPLASVMLIPILIWDAAGTDFVITNNYIGGRAASCGGAALSFDVGGVQNSFFYAIYVNAGASGACTVQSNTITNISVGANCQNANTYYFLGVAVTGGYVVVNNNTIGGSTGNGSINALYSTTSTTGFVWGGILSNAVMGSVSNNNIGSITVGGGKTNQTGSVRAIECDGALTSGFVITGNTIGSTTTANSIQYSPSAITPVQMMMLFLGTTGGTNVTISNNIFQNITNNTTGTTNTFGIYTQGSSLTTVTQNTVANLTSTIPATLGMVGIYEANTTAGQTISNNIIHDLANTTGGAIVDDINGIYYAGPTTGVNSISANAIYNLTLSSTSTAATIYGINIVSGIATTSNNMIALGNGLATGYAINGIYQNSGTAANNHYFNSVYIGGVVGAAGSNTNAFYSRTATHTIENNIFYNARTGGTGKHYAIDVLTKAGVTSNYNDLFSSVAANLGSVNGGGVALTYAGWQVAAPAGDANSLNVDPLFVAVATPDLHITAGSPVITKALAGTGITIDFDTDVRSSTPDMGADEYHTNYYSKAAGNLELVTSWGLNTNGSGANPINFTTRDCSFNIRNNPTPTIGAAWTVSGSGNLVILGDGISACNFTIPGAFSFTGTINLSNIGTLTNQNITNPTFGVINSGSTVNYNSANGVAQTIATVTYGNLILSNSTGAGSSTKTLAATISVVGDLTISGYASFDMVTFNANRTGGGGTLTLSANGTLKLSGTTGGSSPTAGTSSFPLNFATMTLNSASTVEYYGAAQTIYDVLSYGNLTISTAGNKTAGGNLDVNGNLLINTGTFVGGALTHSIAGNWTNNLAFTQNTSTVLFNGTLLQTISGSTTTTFNKFTLANAAGVTLATPANVSNILTLTTGPLFLNSQKLTITNAATAAVTRTAGYVVSETNLAINPSILQWNIGATLGAHVFPFGTSAGGYIPVTINNAGNVGNISISTRPTAASDNLPWAGASDVAAVSNMNDAAGTDIGTYGVIDRWWDITSSVASPIPAVTLSLSYMGTENTIFNSGDLLGIQHWNGAVWDNGNNGGNSTFISTAAVGSTAGGAHTVTGTSASTYFSPYVLIGISAPLPIELLSFTATPNKTKVDIKWTTQSETNNKNFTVERSSDAQKFTEVTTLNSKAPNGNSILKLDYQTTDANPLNGTSYYRLKQTDYNGKFKYFNVVPVVFENNNITFTILPNPNQGQFKVDFTGIENNHEVQILMHDEHGKLVYSNSFYAQESLNSVTIIPEQKIGKGVYFCSFIAEGIKYTVKVVVE